MMNIITNNRLMCTVIAAALERVIDPELGLNVIDLGLIYQVDVDEENKVIYVSMTLTTRFCPMGGSLTSSVSEMIKKTVPDYEVDLQLVFEPSWNYERISEEGKNILNR